MYFAFIVLLEMKALIPPPPNWIWNFTHWLEMQRFTSTSRLALQTSSGTSERISAPDIWNKKYLCVHLKYMSKSFFQIIFGCVLLLLFFFHILKWQTVSALKYIHSFSVVLAASQVYSQYCPHVWIILWFTLDVRLSPGDHNIWAPSGTFSKDPAHHLFIYLFVYIIEVWFILFYTVVTKNEDQAENITASHSPFPATEAFFCLAFLMIWDISCFSPGKGLFLSLLGFFFFFFDHMAIKFFMFIGDRGIWIFRSLRASCLGSFSDKDFTLLFVETSSWPTVILTSPAAVIWAACYLFAGPEEFLTPDRHSLKWNSTTVFGWKQPIRIDQAAIDKLRSANVNHFWRNRFGLNTVCFQTRVNNKPTAAEEKRKSKHTHPQEMLVEVIADALQLATDFLHPHVLCCVMRLSTTVAGAESCDKRVTISTRLFTQSVVLRRQ